MLKRWLSLLLVFCMVATMPATATFAEEAGEPAAAESIEQPEAPSAPEADAVEPTAEPTEAPAEGATEAPTVEPTAEPTETPAESATEAPTAEPTEEPTAEPTAEPTEEPTEDDLSAFPLTPKAVLPEPQGLTATVKSYNAVQLTWNAVAGATRYEVHYRTQYESTYTTVQADSTTSWTVNSLTTGMLYYFGVRAVKETPNTIERSRWSTDLVSCTPTLNAPTLTITPANTQVTLTWTKVSGAHGYVVYRAEGEGPETQLTVVSGADTLKFIDQTTLLGHNYRYTVRAYRNVGDGRVEGKASNIKVAEMLPSPPTGLKVTTASSNTIRLQWTKVDGVDSYTVYRANSIGGTQVKLNDNVTETTYIDTGLISGAEYWYAVASNVIVNGVKVQGEQSTMKSGSAHLLYPENIAIGAVTESSVSLSWTVDPLASGYRITYQKMGEAAQYHDVKDNVGHTTVEGLNALTAYNFYVESYIKVSGTNTYSERSPGYTVTTSPSAPTINSITQADYQSATIEWTTIPGVSGYQLQRRVKGETSWRVLHASIAQSTSTYLNKGLVAGTEYEYRLRAFKDDAGTMRYSAFSAIKSFQPMLAPPVITKAEKLDGTTVKLTWTIGQSGRTGYAVYGRVEGSGTEYSLYARTDSQTGTITLHGMTTGTNMEFVVYATRIENGNIVNGEASAPVVVAMTPNKPRNLKSTHVNETSMNITWEASVGATEYEVWLKDKIAGTEEVRMTSTAALSYLAENLVTGHTYQIRIVPVAVLNGNRVQGDEAKTDNMTRPAVPTNLKVSAYNTDQARLTWDRVSMSMQGDKGYELQRYNASTSTWDVLIRIVDPNTTSYIDKTVDPGIVTKYRVFSFVFSEGKRIKSLSSNTVSIVCKPRTPTDLRTVSKDEKTIEISFTAASAATIHTLYVSTSKDGTYNVLAYFPAAEVGARTYLHTPVATGVTYYYKVRPTVMVGTDRYAGDYSNVVSGTAVPQAPVLSASGGSGAASVRLTWNKVSGAQFYFIYRSETPEGGFANIGRTENTSFNDTTAQVGKQYYYRARANVVVNGFIKNSPFSNRVTVQVRPGKPTGLKLIHVSYDTLKATWLPVGGITRYVMRITRTDEPADPINQNIPAGTTELTVPGLATGGDYLFELTAATDIDIGTTLESDKATVTGKPIPAKPTNLKAQTIGGEHRLTWDPVPGAVKYRVDQSIDGAPYTMLNGNVPAPSYNAPTGEAGHRIRYIVYAIGGKNARSAASSPVEVSSQPASASQLNVRSFSASQLRLTWKPAIGLGWSDRYLIERSLNGVDGFVQINAVAGDVTTYTDRNLTPGTTYFYRVRSLAQNGGSLVYGGFSNIASNYPRPRTPVISSVTADNKKVQVQWLSVSGACHGYEVSYRAASEIGYTTAIVGKINQYTVSNPIGGEKYEFRIRSYYDRDGRRTYSDYSQTVQSASYAKPYPKYVTATASGNDFVVTWQAVRGAKHYLIKVNGKEKPDQIAGTSWVLSGATIGSTVEVRVQAVYNNNDKSIWSKASTASLPFAVPVLKLDSATASGVNLSWSAVPGAKGYRIYRKEGSAGSFNQLTDVLGGNPVPTVYRDQDISLGKTYYYRVRAIAADDTLSSFSNIVYTRVLPAKPKLQVQAADAHTLNLTWMVGSDFDGYVLYRATSLNGTYHRIRTGGKAFSTTNTARSSDSHKITVGTTYYYQLAVFKMVDGKRVYSEKSDIVSGRAAPKAPSLNAAAQVSATQARLQWNNVPTATKYRVYARRGSETAARTMLLETTGTSAIVSSLTPGETYWFEVEALRGRHAGNASNRVKFASTLGKVTGVTATAKSGRIVEVKWDNLQVSGYEVYLSTGNPGQNQRYLTTVTGGTTATIKDQAPGEICYYGVRAFITVPGQPTLFSPSITWSAMCNPLP